jgi:hydrogenase/urease accessory protein HupE
MARCMACSATSLHQPVVTHGGAANDDDFAAAIIDPLPRLDHLVCAEHALFGLFGELAQKRSLTLIGLGNRFASVP